MQITQKKIAVLSLAVLLASVVSSCKKDSDITPAVSISDAAKTVDESVGAVVLTVDLGKAASEDVTINYEISGTAVLNGDFEVTSASSITIAKGNTTGTLNLSVFDDSVLESDKSIIVKFSSANLTFTNAQSEITITDNEPDISTDGLQIDLTWDAGNLVNLDLYTANNVVIGTDNYIESFNLVQSSDAEKGFESVFMDNDDSDDEYYIVINYNAGDRAVNYMLNYNGPSITNEEVKGSLEASDEGYAVFYGPVNKSGATYSRTSKSGLEINKAAHFYKGKVVR